MEIERKFLVKEIPGNLEQYDRWEIEQGYLCKKPTVRIRKYNDAYVLTYKSKLGLTRESEESLARVCEEVELPLTKDSYEHLREKVDGNLVTKTRYIIPIQNGLKIELDIFKGKLKGLIVAEVEFPSEKDADEFGGIDWFGDEVTSDKKYSNSYLSTLEGIGVK